MRFHVLGLGSIGTFLAHHLRQSLRTDAAGRGSTAAASQAAATTPNAHWLPYLAPDPTGVSITLQISSQAKAANFCGTLVEHAGTKTYVGPDQYRIEAQGLGEIVPDAISGTHRTRRIPDFTDAYQERSISLPPTRDGPSMVQQLGFTDRSDAIDSLLVTTKADRALDAVRPLAPRLTPATTIVLLQNGMGVVDELVDGIWPDERQRPRFVLGNVTHGCWSKRPFQSVHAGLGSIFLGLPPYTLSSLAHDNGSDGATNVSAIHSLSPSADTSAPEPAQLAQSPLHLSLLYTLSTLLTIPALDARLEPTYQAYLARALQKLAVNACINPLTAILDCKNGALLGDRCAEGIWNDVLHEASSVFLALATSGSDAASLSPTDSRHGRPNIAEWSHLIQRPLVSRSGSPGQPEQGARPVLDASLTPPALLQLVRTVARATSANFSSMHRDLLFPSTQRPNRLSYGKALRRPLSPRMSTEMPYLNGWLAKRGRELGVRTDVNDTLVRLIGSLCSLGERHHNLNGVAIKKGMRQLAQRLGEPPE